MPLDVDKHLLKEIKLRVYGVIRNDNAILLSHESYKKSDFCKFPGGGLELGETPIDTLHREIHEELDVSILSERLVHVTNMIVQNKFDPTQQVIGLYYEVTLSDEALALIDIQINQSFNQGGLSLVRREWCHVEDVEKKLSFEMDRNALRYLK